MTFRTRLGGLLLIVLMWGCSDADTITRPSTSSTLSPDPVVPPGPSCRTYATNVEVSGARYPAISSFDPVTHVLSTRQADGCRVATVSYASVADFVDEVAVIPPRTLARSSDPGFCIGFGHPGPTTYFYDQQRRLIRGENFYITMLYSRWDTRGRPIVGAAQFNGYTSLVSYDETARTMTENLGTSVVVTRYDADGIMRSTDTLDQFGRYTTTYTPTATAQICR